jgi:hypothetical protein
MDHISVSKRGEVLLKKKFRLLELSAPPASAAKRSYESYFKDNLSTVDVEALGCHIGRVGNCHSCILFDILSF